MYLYKGQVLRYFMKSYVYYPFMIYDDLVQDTFLSYLQLNTFEIQVKNKKLDYFTLQLVVYSLDKKMRPVHARRNLLA